MFQLNPAPFCMLTGMHPRRSRNTERFYRLMVKHVVADPVHLISHSKITMEMAQQLVGSRCNEGVSRVEVDIEKKRCVWRRRSQPDAVNKESNSDGDQ